jgi:cobalt-zinc-cadmium efflux system protein
MAHNHAHSDQALNRRLVLSTALTLAFVLAEAAAGLWANSLALLADAGHNFADALALAISWYALWMAQRPANARKTFGYHRVGILAALVNAVSLVVIALAIAWEAGQRLRTPEPTAGGWMIGVAFLAALLNGAISLWLRHDAARDLNIRAAFIHMLGDFLASIGVVVAGIVIALTGSSVADPLVSLLIAALILWSSWDILIEAVDVLLEAVPKGLDMAEVEQALKGVTGVLDIHDLHVWTIASGIIACSCHILVAEQSIKSGQQVLRAAALMLRERFNVTHPTIQVEVEGCDPSDMYCAMKCADSSQP